MTLVNSSYFQYLLSNQVTYAMELLFANFRRLLKQSIFPT